MAEFEIYKGAKLEFRLALSSKQQVANARINSDFKPDQNTE